ncbi:MAG TPA: glycosyltransferase, partial [Chloroflexota bacterium]|nr:glycosyltransferase [Chloroflexota bacterium]
SLPNGRHRSRAYGLPFFPVDSPAWNLAALRALLRSARAWDADWLHLQYAPGSFDRRRAVGLLPLLARAMPGGPRIAVTVHEYGGWPVALPGPLGALGERAFSIGERLGVCDREGLTLLGSSHLTIGTNADHRSAIASRSTALARRLTLIPIGPNIGPDAAPDPTHGLARLRLNVPSDQVIGVFFGFVHPVKGIEYLLHALRKARASHPELRLWIVGGVQSLALRGAEADSYEAKVRALIAELALDDIVTFTGFLPDAEVASRLQAADFAVLPFNHGATLKSGTLISCFSFGLPVITTEGGDLGALRHGESLWLVQSRDPYALAAGLEAFAADPALRQRLGAASRQASFAYDWSAIAARHRELYGDNRRQNTEDRIQKEIRRQAVG